ncbi:ATP-binding protein [Mycolicibacterium phlei]
MTSSTTTCESCGTGLRVNAKFCDECGAATAARHEAANYKQVTVLFVDVVRSMDIAATLDLERLREIMTTLVERLAAVARRYEGGMIEYTGDGLMTVFGAPVALEDHALRACLAGLAMQQETNRLGAEVRQRDGVDLRVRVGLNSGRVIAGELGAGALGFSAIGEQVGLAQRMESVAPPGGVMLTESTAELVRDRVMMCGPEWVRIKGAEEPVCVYRLTSVRPREVRMSLESVLVGRDWEIAALDSLVQQSGDSRGGVAAVVGPPGIGKSRVAREVAALAAAREVQVFWAFCESHTRDVPFYAATRLLRAATGIATLGTGDAAREVVRRQFPNADPEDLLLLDDLLGVAAPGAAPPQIDPEARRRRLTAVLTTAALTRTTPSLYVIEDAHWIDPVSESMIADLLTAVPRSAATVLITFRPEYHGALSRAHGAHTISLAPLDDSDITTLLTEQLGADPSVRGLGEIIARQAAGNPFFAEEIVRELLQRGVLAGSFGGYTCRTDASEIGVPATVEATVEARIDRLSRPARQTLNAASVIGARFDAGLLATLGIEPVLDELLDVELIDQTRFTPTAEYAFRHPLIRAVTYESQLKADRAQWHRRLAAALQERERRAVEEDAALIAEHLCAAGDLRAAYEWHMRAGASSTERDFSAARLSWERARQIADALPDDDPDRPVMRVAPRTMLCATAFHDIKKSQGRFAELRELSAAIGDKVSLAIGMTGMATELLYAGRSHEGARLASEQMALLESIGDPSLTVGLSFVALVNWFDSGAFDEVLRWTTIVIDLADGDPTMGADFGMGSPLAAAMAVRGVVKWWLGQSRWRRDVDDAIAMIHSTDPASQALLLAWTYGLAVSCGVLPADDAAVRDIELSVRTARARSNDFALGMAEYVLGHVLLWRDDDADRQRGLAMLSPAEDMWRDRGPHLIHVIKLAGCRERVMRGEREVPLQVMRDAVEALRRAHRLTFHLWGAGLFVEALLERPTTDDIAEAEGLIESLADQEPPSAMLDITLLRLRTLLARSRGDDTGFRESLRRYRARAVALGFEGHIAWADAM